MYERSYQELKCIDNFYDRLKYLTLLDNEWDSPREMSYEFFRSHLWKRVRQEIINRDMVFDLGVFGVDITSKVLVHHINPITKQDIIHQTKKLIDPNNLITVSVDTHNRIHYGDGLEEPVERFPGDTILW